MRKVGVSGPPVSHQTVKLARGKHTSPDDGVCAMELASMLAGEEFSDHPRSVCLVIGAFLRAYNDCVDDRRRQDLYEYAAKVVGTRSTIGVERDRAQMCCACVRRMRGQDTLPDEPVASQDRLSRLRRWLLSCHREFAGHQAGMAFGRVEAGSGDGPELDQQRHRSALRFLDELIAVGRPNEPQLDHLAISDQKRS